MVLRIPMEDIYAKQLRVFFRYIYHIVLPHYYSSSRILRNKLTSDSDNLSIPFTKNLFIYLYTKITGKINQLTG